MTSEVPSENGRFLRVKCKDCSNVQTLFDRASTEVKCLVCGATLAVPRGGIADIRGEVEEVLR